MAADLMKSFLVVALLVLLRFSHHSSARIGEQLSSDLISKYCSETRDAKLCAKILNGASFIPSADLYGAVDIAIRTATNKVSEMSSYAKTMMLKATRLKEEYTMCSKIYDNAVIALVDAGSLLGKHAYQNVISNANHMRQEVAACEAAFKKKRHSPLKQGNHIILVLGDVITVMAKKLT
ncbi:hypothetical protein FRX31_031196 [Thalictrum thalictroides]|uniref:Pectinesterase inhibitor domain-containing protein n=1 Tax=Thalictrum thalictroides TaxID=46969 RepID=A0A7J6V2I5_THATH|nr:hypothetical protein FRX31_031196 [Thalictrum thalictroides]